MRMGRGRTLLHGLFDAHVHVPANPEPALRQLASLGVTTAWDMFGGGEKLKAKKRIESEDPAGMADLRASGFGATTSGSGLGMMARQLPAISSPGQAPACRRSYCRGLGFHQNNQIGGPLDRETLQAI